MKVEILAEGVHSGEASGIVPDTFRIARMLLSRLENPETGEIIFEPLKSKVSEQVQQNVRKTAQVLGLEKLSGIFPFVPGANAVSTDPFELAMNRWWRPQLTVTGAAGLPPCEVAGNVLRPSTSLVLSIRLPPNVDAPTAHKAVEQELSRDPPYGCKVSFVGEKAAGGWEAPPSPQWLMDSLDKASTTAFGKSVLYSSEGGSIPFMGMLGRLFPKASFCVCGVLGPGSNAHGPNEFLEVDFSARLTISMALVLNDHFNANAEKIGSSAPVAINGSGELSKEYIRKKDGTKL